jgi:hypothetical protein
MAAWLKRDGAAAVLPMAISSMPRATASLPASLDQVLGRVRGARSGRLHL